MLRYAFRLHRWGLVGFATIMVLSPYIQAGAFAQSAGTTAGQRAAFAHEMSALAVQLSYLLPAPYRVDTLAGYVQWRAWGTLSVVVSVWAIAAAASAVRGDEEKQLVDSWLAARVSRPRLVASRLASFGAAALVAVVAASLSTVLAAARYEPVSMAGVVGKALALWLLMVTLFALCSLVAQLTASLRGAQAAGAGLVVVLYLCDIVARSQHSLNGLSWVSPFRWYDATDAMAPGGHLDVAGVGLSVATILAAGGLTALAFARRDLRGPLFSLPIPAATRDVPPSPALAWPVTRLLYRQRWTLAAWTLITALVAVFMVALAHGTVESLLSLPGMRAFLTHGSSDPYQGFIATFWFGTAELLIAGFAVHLVSGWAADDTEGILAAVLSTPRHRWAVIAERAGAAVVGITVVVAVGSLAAAIASASLGTSLDAAGVFRASWPLVPFALTFAAAGAVASTRWPRAAIGVLGVLAFASFMTADLPPLMNWPGWVADLSVFQLYGTPLLTGVFWNGLWAMLAIVAAGFGAATLLMQRREVGP